MFIYYTESFPSVPAVYLYCWPVRATMTLCNHMNYDSDVKMLPFIDLCLRQSQSPWSELAWRGCVSLPQLCQANMAFWQNLLPLVLRSPRTSREHGPSLFPIFWATNRTKQNMFIVLPKGPLPNVTPTTTAATTAVCPSGRPAVTVPEFTGAFPAVWTAISIHCPAPPHQQPLGAPHFGMGPEAFCLAFFLKSLLAAS